MGADIVSCTMTVTDGRIASIIFLLSFLLFSNVFFLLLLLLNMVTLFPFFWSRETIDLHVHHDHGHDLFSRLYLDICLFSFYLFVPLPLGGMEWGGTRRNEDENEN